MENLLNKDLDMNSGEFFEYDVFSTPNWVFSDIKYPISEPLQLTTNNSVQIIKNEVEG